jgi:hypothetical protein
MDFDGGVFVRKVDALETGFGDNALQFVQQRIAVLTSHICPVNF